MQKIKKIVALITFFSILSIQIFSLADDEFDEEFDFTQFNEFLQTVDSQVNKEPQINSRHAVIYDRKARKNIIWQKRK